MGERLLFSSGINSIYGFIFSIVLLFGLGGFLLYLSSFFIRKCILPAYMLDSSYHIAVCTEVGAIIVWVLLRLLLFSISSMWRLLRGS